jgi:RHH-type proline utilization regulon transcriptional repressor/proline dehydrogenase/delta 1-pyrroline-5-carboxylate dehydrogenase
VDLEANIATLGKKLFELAKGEEPGLFNRSYWQGRILDWVMKDPGFKVDLLRFVDVLPQLTTTKATSEHIKQYLLREDRKLPLLIGTALRAATMSLTQGLATKAIRDNVMDMAGRFIVGSTASEAVKSLRKLHQEGIGFTVDLLGEATLSEKEGEIYQKRYVSLIEELAAAVDSWPAEDVVDRNHLGPIPRTNVSLKISAMYSQLRPSDPSGTVAQLKKRLVPILRKAKERNVFVNFDLEQWDYHAITYDLFEEIVTDAEFRNWPHLGIVVQAYLKEAAHDVDRLYSIAKSRGCPLTVRLVKGAYWDYEVVRARQKGHEAPVLIGKSSCDAAYEQLSSQLVDHVDFLQSAFGSHNLRSLAHAIAYAESKGLPRSAYEIQMLYGMAEPERSALKSLGHRVRLYAPVGDPLIGMAYLVRRLLENTSNSGFLQLTHHAKTDTEALMRKPVPELTPVKPTSSEFENCPHLDFLKPSVQKDFQANIDRIRGSFPVEVPAVVDGVKKVSTDLHSHFCPSVSSLKVYDIACAQIEDVDAAIASSYKAFLLWRDRSVDERAAILSRLADILERDRVWLAALQTLEVGKPWTEADGDLVEAIDFCRYYARRAKVELGPIPQGHMLGEDNTIHYVGRGPTAIIAPWNFPLAILCGMSTAALVTGNSILMKPSEQSSMTAFALYERMIEAGFPKDVVQFLPGRGEVIGKHLVDHPMVAQIAFTGSKAVGLSIYRSAAMTNAEQPELKRVVCEMGGKNAIVVDDDADLDEAVTGIVTSAFGFAGQKCSACSRVVVLESVADALIERLVEATRSLPMEEAFLPSSFFGPVIDAESHARLLKEIDDAKKNAKLHYLGEAKAGGFFVPAAIFEVSDQNHHLMQDELFGPIIAVMRVPDFAAALTVANSTRYALTGAIYSRSPKNLELARREFRVGNLYVNRGSTGAMVDRQPFGGFHMSGLGSKAGGPGYLMFFTDPICITENTMRRGFTPELAVS